MEESGLQTASGPAEIGRNPGIVKPDCVAFSGSDGREFIQSYRHQLLKENELTRMATLAEIGRESAIAENQAPRGGPRPRARTALAGVCKGR
jgi:hypothetical protein